MGSQTRDDAEDDAAVMMEHAGSNSQLERLERGSRENTFMQAHHFDLPTIGNGNQA